MLSLYARSAGSKGVCVSPSEPETPDVSAAAFADLGHAMRNPLTIIRVRTRMLQRAVHRDATLTEAHRTLFLRDLASIDTAVSVLVEVLDGLDQDHINAARAPSEVPSPDSR